MRPETTLGRDFWAFFAGQTISSFGTAFTRFALPLLVFDLTGSALNLALTTAATFLPVVLFGLFIGVWVDRANRKRIMILADVARALVIGSLPLLAFSHLLAVWWIYASAFISSLLAMCFETGQYAAISALVAKGDLMRANGLLQSSYGAMTVLGSLIGGILLAVVTLPLLLLIDAVSFLISALSLAAIRREFDANASRERSAAGFRTDLLEGLRYVRRHRILRNIALLFILINAVAPTVNAQIVLFAREGLRASNPQVGFLYGAGSVGVIVLSLLAGRLRRRWPYNRVALGALMLNGLCTIALALTPWYWLAIPVWAVVSGASAVVDIATGSLGQSIVPAHLMGRVMSVLRVLAWSTIPPGTVIGGLIIQRTGHVAMVYAAIGAVVVLVSGAFWLGPLGRADVGGE